MAILKEPTHIVTVTVDKDYALPADVPLMTPNIKDVLSVGH